MKLKSAYISNFQSFGPQPTWIPLRKRTFFVGPNGAGKTAVLQALCRMFAFDQKQRGITIRDFHRPAGGPAPTEPVKLWVEAEFTLPEAAEEDFESSTIPACFDQMRLEDDKGNPILRIRLDAILHPDQEIEETLNYVTKVNENGEPVEMRPVNKADRHYIQMHYLPARRDPSDHIAYTATSLLGKYLRAVEWAGATESLNDLNSTMHETLAENSAIKSLGKQISKRWEKLHRGDFFSKPSIRFGETDITRILKLLSVTFSPSHQDGEIEFSRLSDGQKSLLYITLVLASQKIGADVIAGKNASFDATKLRPPVFTMVAMEEPENSLSPHYLGRVIQELNRLGKRRDSQILVTTHSPAILRRVDPRNIRHLRLDESRKTVVRKILLPEDDIDESKYVREAVQAFPELYFSRFVVLSEGPTEQIILHRLLTSGDLAADDSSISVVPLGGRHVNHFWRLLSDLQIPYITLLDFDLGRFGAGWGRIKYAAKQLVEVGISIRPDYIKALPKWNDDRTDFESHIKSLEVKGVFFSYPLDMDFLMLETFPEAYGIDDADRMEPDDATYALVLGKSHSPAGELFYDTQLDLFDAYAELFKRGSKPGAHFEALSSLTDAQLQENMPEVLQRFVKSIGERLEALSE